MTDHDVTQFHNLCTTTPYGGEHMHMSSYALMHEVWGEEIFG